MSFILLWSPTILGHVSLPVAVKADNLSSVIAALSLGLSSGFLWAVSLHVSRCVTPITIPQVVECVLTLRIEYGCPNWSRVGSSIDDQRVPCWGGDHVHLHSDLSCLTQVVLLSGPVRILQSSHVWVWISQV